MRARNLRTVLALTGITARQVLGAASIGALGVGCSVALIGVAAWLIARASQMPPVLDLSVAAVAVRAFGIGRAVLRYLERIRSHDLALAGQVRLREQLFRRLAQADPRVGLGLRRGDLLARLGVDVDAVGDVLVKGVMPFAVAGLVSLAAIVASFVILPAAGVALALALLLAGVVAPWLAGAAAARAHRSIVDTRGRLSAGVLTHLESHDELIVAGAASRSRDLLDGLEADNARAVDSVSRWNGLAAACQFIATLIGVGGALWFGSAAVEADRLPEVMLAVICLLPLAAVEACAPLTVAAADLVAGSQAAGRLTDLLTPVGDDAVAGASTTTEPGLTADGLVVGWQQPLTALPTELRCPPGTFVAISGHSGIGKTTLGLTLAGLLTPLAGTVRLDGVPLAEVDDLPRRVSFTAHDAHLFATTVRENLRVAARKDCPDDELLTACRQAGLDGWLSEQPEGLNSPLTPSALSGGERRRFLLTRALLTGAQVVILDEPTEHLDPEAAAGVAAELRALAHESGRTIIVITHDALPADRLITFG